MSDVFTDDRGETAEEFWKEHTLPNLPANHDNFNFKIVDIKTKDQYIVRAMPDLRPFAKGGILKGTVSPLLPKLFDNPGNSGMPVYDFDLAICKQPLPDDIDADNVISVIYRFNNITPHIATIALPREGQETQGNLWIVRNIPITETSIAYNQFEFPGENLFMLESFPFILGKLGFEKLSRFYASICFNFTVRSVEFKHNLKTGNIDLAVKFFSDGKVYTYSLSELQNVTSEAISADALRKLAVVQFLHEKEISAPAL